MRTPIPGDLHPRVRRGEDFPIPLPGQCRREADRGDLRPRTAAPVVGWRDPRLTSRAVGATPGAHGDRADTSGRVCSCSTRRCGGAASRGRRWWRASSLWSTPMSVGGPASSKGQTRAAPRSRGTLAERRDSLRGLGGRGWRARQRDHRRGGHQRPVGRRARHRRSSRRRGAPPGVRRVRRATAAAGRISRGGLDRSERPPRGGRRPARSVSRLLLERGEVALVQLQPGRSSGASIVPGGDRYRWSRGHARVRAPDRRADASDRGAPPGRRTRLDWWPGGSARERATWTLPLSTRFHDLPLRAHVDLLDDAVAGAIARQASAQPPRRASALGGPRRRGLLAALIARQGLASADARVAHRLRRRRRADNGSHPRLPERRERADGVPGCDPHTYPMGGPCVWARRLGVLGSVLGAP